MNEKQMIISNGTPSTYKPINLRRGHLTNVYFHNTRTKRYTYKQDITI